MKDNGFTLIELMVVIAIIGALTAAGTLAFNTMSRKNAIEAQTKEMYSDLMKAKSDALFQKSSRTVDATASQITITDGAGTTVLQKSFKQAIAQNNASALSFNESGLADVPKAYCIGDAGNSGAIDSIIVNSTIILTGKRTAGACISANIQAR